MSALVSRCRRAGALVLCVRLLACAPSDERPPPSPQPSTSATDDIIGGVDARGTRLDAIGALVTANAEGVLTPFCTATLVAPQWVLSAKHCVADGGSGVSFVVGADARAPRARYATTEVVLAPDDVGGYARLGQDVALFRLAKPVTDLAPLRYVADHLPAEAIGTRFTAVGYGVRDQAKSSGQRKAGTLTLRATSGQPMHAFFPTVDDLRARLLASDGEEWVARNRDRIQQLYDHRLKVNAEAFVGLSVGDAQPCSGDSGGPLLGRVGDENVVVAVVSASFKTPAYACSTLGEFYATLGPGVQEMLSAALGDTKGAVAASALTLGPASSVEALVAAQDCATLGAKGTCVGDTALRCVAPDEGPEAITANDCSLLGARCGVATEGGVACLDAPPKD